MVGREDSDLGTTLPPAGLPLGWLSGLFPLPPCLSAFCQGQSHGKGHAPRLGYEGPSLVWERVMALGCISTQSTHVQSV